MLDGILLIWGNPQIYRIKMHLYHVVNTKGVI